MLTSTLARVSSHPATTDRRSQPLAASLASLLRKIRPWLPASGAALALASLGLSTPAHAAAPYYFSVNSGNWETAANWSDGTVPTAASSTIYLGGLNYPPYNGPASPTVNVTALGDVGSFVSNWGTLNINSGSSLTLAGLSNGDTVGTSGITNVSGSLTVTSTTSIGGGGFGKIVVNNGGSFTANTIQLNSGQLNIQTGGTLAARIIFYGGSGTLNLNGGTLKATASSLIANGSPGSIMINADSTIDSNGFDIGINWSLGGTGGLIKAGTGNLTLNVVATYSGGTTVNGGTLTAGKANALVDNTAYTVNSGGTLALNNFDLIASSLAGTGGTVSLGTATLTVNQTTNTAYAGAISGSGGLIKKGAGILTLSGTNTYGGTTTVNGGMLSIGAATNLGAGALTLNGGALQTTATLTLAQAVTLGSSGGEFNVTAGTTSASAIGGAGSLLKSGAGTLAFSGTSTYAGTTTVTGGILSIGAANNISSNALTLNGGALQTTSTLTLAQTVTLGSSGGEFNVTTGTTSASAIGGTGSLLKSGTGTLTLSGTSTYAGTTTVTGGILSIGAANNISTNTLILNGGALQTTGTLALTSAVSLGLSNGEFNVATGTTTTSTGVIGGIGSLLKSGAGTLVLQGTNNYGGTTTVTGGTLSIGADTALGHAGNSLTLNGGTLQTTATLTTGRAIILGVNSGTLDVANGTTFTINGTGSLLGSGNLTKSGTGTLVLGATNGNGYTGTTTVTGGILSINAANQLSSNTLTLNGGALQTTATLTLASTVALGSNGGEFNITTGTTSAGAIGGSGNLLKSGTGTLVLSGTSTYGGTTTVTGGILSISAAANISSGALTLNGGALQTTATLTLAPAVTLGSNGGEFNVTTGTTTASAIGGSGNLLKSGAGILALQNTDNYIGSTTVTGGTLSIGADSALGNASNGLTLNGGTLKSTATLTTNRTLSIGVSGGTLDIGSGTTFTISNTGLLTGSGAFTKTGAGTLSLTGANSHSGTTAVTAGMLRVDGSLASSSIDVQNSATLAGAGTLGGSVTLENGGALGDTSKIETLHISGALTFNSGSTWNVEGNNSTFDQIVVGGTATIQTGAKLNLTGNWNAASYTLLSTVGGITGGSGIFTLQNTLPTGYKIVYGQNAVLLLQPPTIGTITSTPTDGTIITGGQTNVTVTVQNAGQSGTAPLNPTATGSGNLSGTGTSAPITAGNTGTISTPLVFTGTTVGTGQTGTVTVTDPAASNSPKTGTVSVNVLDHASPSLTLTSGNNQTVIVGATGVTSSLKLANGTVGDANRSPMDVSTLSSGLAGTTGSGVIASGSSGNYTATLNAGAVGNGQLQSFSLKAGDQQTLPGASALTTQSLNVTLDVLDHAAPNFSLTSGNNQTVIVGATGITATLTLANGTAGDTSRSAMDVNTLSTGLSGATGSGVIASGSSSTYTAALNTGTAGAGQTQAFSLKAGDQQTLAGASALTTQSQNVTLNVYGHAAPNLSATTLDLGINHEGYTSSVVSNTQTVTNGSPGDYVVDLKAGALSSGNVSVNGFSGLSAGNSTSISATLATGQTAGSLNQSLTYTFADDSTLAGASSNVGTATLSITGQVYTGQGVWNSPTGGSWGTLASGFGANWQAGGGSPGLDAAFTSTDTATFGTAGHGTVRLDGANPSLKGITFDNSSASYLISQGTGGGITFNGGSNAATLTDALGSHEISAPITLATDLVTTITRAVDRLTISGTISGSHNLTVQGDGNLLVSGNNTGFSGNTTINAGTVVTMHANALGTGLVALNAGATLAPVVALSLNNFTWNGGTVSLDPTSAQITVANTLDMTAPGQFFLTGEHPNTKYDLLTYATLGSTTDAFSANLFYGIAPTFTVVDNGDGTSSVQVEYIGAIIGPILSNASPYFTPTNANFHVAEPTVTAGGDNTVSSLIFTPGGTLHIFNTLTLTSGNVSAGAGTYAIEGGTLFGPNGLHFDIAGNLFIGSTLIGDTTKTGQGALFLDGQLIGNLNLLQGLLGGNGSIIGNLINSGILSPGHSPGQTHVTGDYTQTSSGVLRIEIGGRDLSQHDLVSVDGTAKLDGTLQLVRLNQFKLKRNKAVTFLTADGGVTGRFSLVENEFTSDTILKPTVVYHQDSVALEAVQGSFAGLPNLTPNQKAVARNLDSAAHDQRADAIFEYLDYRKLDKLPGDFDKIAPEELTSIFTIGTSLAKVQSGNIQRRNDDIRGGSGGFSAAGLAVNGTGPSYSGSFGLAGPTGPISSDDGKDVKETKQVIAPAENRWGAFLSGTGEWASVGNTNNARGYDLTSGGFTLGLDYKVTPNLAIGLAAGYTGSSADLTDRGRVYVNGGKLGLYATFFDYQRVNAAPTTSKDAKEVLTPSYNVAKGFYADVAVFGGYNSYDTRRSALQGEARGDTEGGELNVLFGTGYDFKKSNFTFGPTASFNYTYLGTDAFTEHGSLAPLNIHGGKGESLRTAFGFKASYDWKVGSVLIKPEIRAAWQHEFGDAAYALDSSFANGAGDTFRVNGPQLGRDSALLGAGFAVQFNERFSTYFYYDGELGAKNYQSTSVTGGVRLAF